MSSSREQVIYDILVVGAGPASLATAARLREPVPAALFTDEEHRRYHWLHKHGQRVSLKHARSGKITPGKTGSRNHGGPGYNMLVLDSTADSWLGTWKGYFNAFGITHLRSPMLWHVDPADRDALLAKACLEDRRDEMVEIRNCVGKEMSKHAMKKKAKGQGHTCGSKQHARVAINIRERNDYYTPSLDLFCDHCQQVADRYELGRDLLRKETVQDITYDVVRGTSVDDEKLFTVKTDSTTRYCRSVILGVGPANSPQIPRLPSMLHNIASHPQATHSMHIKEFPSKHVQSLIDSARPTNVLIIGGGLTSAQLSDLAIRRGVTKVWHLMRGRGRVQHFDVDLSWMGKYKNAEQARFWAAESDQERLEIYQSARGGGSITPLFWKRLRKHVESGKVVLKTETKVVDAVLEESKDAAVWRIETEPKITGLPHFDHIYFATGIVTDISSLPYLQNMLGDYPIDTVGGFPCLNEDLMWKDDVPLFVVGRLAALKIGPAAPNLGGVKVAAERVAWAIENMASRSKAWGAEDATETGDGEEGDGREHHEIEQYLSGHGNMYNILSCE